MVSMTQVGQISAYYIYEPNLKFSSFLHNNNSCIEVSFVCV